MNKKFICIIVAVLLLMPLTSAFSISGLFNWITGKVAEITCTESDGGVDYYVKGYVTVDGVHKYWDSCDGNTIQETYCSPTMRTSYYECPNGCKDGACVKENVTYWKNVDNAVFEKDYLFPPSPATLHLHSLDKYTGWGTLGWFLFGNTTYKDLDENNYDKEHPAVLSFEHSNFSAGSVSIVYDTDTSTGNMLVIYFPEITVETITYPHPTPRLYISKCGSTYWWDKTHDGWGVWNESLRMNPEEAMVPEHLARASPTCGGVITECTDSDSPTPPDAGYIGGITPPDLHIKGTAVGVREGTNEYGEYTDYCFNEDYIIEFYCHSDTGLVSAAQRYCPYGCENSACKLVPKTTTCVDTDNGKNTSVRGTTSSLTYYPRGHIDTCFEQYGGGGGSYFKTCSADKNCFVLEGFCENNNVKIEHIFCPNGCSDGVCLKEAPIVTCIDSDGGIDYYVKGTCYDEVYTEGLTDVCNGLYGVEEYECVPTDSPQFPSGTRCQANLTKGLDVCPHGCSDGACIIPTVKVECTDTDGGKNYFVKGTIAGYDQEGNYFTRDDFCQVLKPDGIGYVTEYCKDQDCFLSEGYCDEYGDPVSEDYQCSYGCSDGACLEAPLTLGCTDTDDGKDYYKKGTVYGIDAEENEYKNEDFCAENKLLEYYCEMDEPTSEYFTCPEGCSGGACLRICPEIIGWRIENGKCVTDSGCDYDSSKYVYYASLEECESQLEECIPEWECKITPPFCPLSGKQTKICKDVKCGMETIKKEISCSAGQCSGCLHDTTCVPYGHRLKVKDISAYCSLDSVFRPQMPEGAECENDYECLSNECSNGKCISTYTLLQKIFELLKAIFGKGWLWGK